MANILQNVATYQMANLALLQNQYCYINKANTKFKDFDRITANRGATVTFDLPPRFTAGNSSLVPSFQDAAQRVETLTVDQADNISYEFSNQEMIFNVNDYVEKFGRSAMAELGARIEAQVAKNININHTYRFYGDGINAINSVNQLAEALAFYRNFGAPMNDVRGILPDVEAATIVGNSLTQFVMDRNEEYANSWELGRYSRCDWFDSNLLPTHTAGTVGQAQTVLTVVSINAAGTQITFSGAANSDANAVKEGDLFEFQDGVAGQPNIRLLTFIGHQTSSNPVQFRATADAASDGTGQVVVNVSPALISDPTSRDQNVSAPIAAGMQVKALPSHKAGLIYGGNAMYLAMPRLDNTEPYPSANKADPDSGVSLRSYYGYLINTAQKGFINDVIWGSTMPQNYAMRLVFPLTSS